MHRGTQIYGLLSQQPEFLLLWRGLAVPGWCGHDVDRSRELAADALHILLSEDITPSNQP